MIDKTMRLIDANALIKKLSDLWNVHDDDDFANKDVWREIENAPTIKPEWKTFHVIDKQTGKEADPYEIALNEEWAKDLMYCDMEGFAILEDGTLMLTDECGKYDFPPDQERFIVEWE